MLNRVSLLAVVAALAAFGTPAAQQPPSPAAAVPRPAITRRLIPLGAQRRRETAAYAQRHYGLDTSELRPLTIVQHWTQNSSVDATYDAFAPDVADAELGELPGTCAQFAIARNGRIVQLAPILFLCRHTVGLNWAAIGIEHVGYSDGEVLGNAVQLRASLRLTRWLRCRYEIPVGAVIGHAESRSSPFHRERVAALRTQTHGDWQPAGMRRYRALLRAAGDC